jgi:hypothetical protein
MAAVAKPMDHLRAPPAPDPPQLWQLPSSPPNQCVLAGCWTPVQVRMAGTPAAAAAAEAAAAAGVPMTPLRQAGEAALMPVAVPPPATLSQAAAGAAAVTDGPDKAQRQGARWGRARGSAASAAAGRLRAAAPLTPAARSDAVAGAAAPAQSNSVQQQAAALAVAPAYRRGGAQVCLHNGHQVSHTRRGMTAAERAWQAQAEATHFSCVQSAPASAGWSRCWGAALPRQPGGRWGAPAAAAAAARCCAAGVAVAGAAPHSPDDARRACLHG